MTVLERLKRSQDRKESCKKPRHLFLNHPSRRRRNEVPLASSLHVKRQYSSALQNLLVNNTRKRQMEEKPSPDVFVLSTIRKTVQDLLREQQSCTLYEMAHSLSQKQLIFDLQSMSPIDQEAYLKSRSGGNGSGLMQNLAVTLKNSLCLFSKEKIDKTERNNRMYRKYQLANAFQKLRNTTGSTTIIKIHSWEEAKAHLSTVLDFSSLTPDLLDESDDDEGITRKYSKALQEISRSSVAGRPVGLTPSQQRFQDMAARTQIPSSITDRLQKRVELEYQRRAEEENERLDAIRAIKEEATRREQEEEAKRLADELMRKMTPEEQTLVKKALYGIGPGTEILAKVGTDTCQRASIQRLQPREWLNDEVIHYFLIMLALRDEQLVKEGKRSRRSHFFKSYFMTKLMNDGDSEKDGIYEYKNVRRWSKNVPGKDIFDLDKIFFPVNVGRTHWVVAVAFMQEKRIQFYDSFGDEGTEWMDAVFRYIKDEHMDKKKFPLPDEDDWQLVACVRGTPRQLNGFDCGVFTCMFCDFLSKDCPLVFNQEHITQCRERICLSILNGRAIL